MTRNTRLHNMQIVSFIRQWCRGRRRWDYMSWTNLHICNKNIRQTPVSTITQLNLFLRKTEFHKSTMYLSPFQCYHLWIDKKFLRSCVHEVLCSLGFGMEPNCPGAIMLLARHYWPNRAWVLVSDRAQRGGSISLLSVVKQMKGWRQVRILQATLTLDIRATWVNSVSVKSWGAFSNHPLSARCKLSFLSWKSSYTSVGETYTNEYRSTH